MAAAPDVALGPAAVTATFASIPHSTQAFITVTSRISHDWPDGDNDAEAGQTITNTAVMTHSTATEITTTNEVSTTVGEPDVSVVKSVESSTAITTDLDGEALLTYTLRLENTGNSPAYSLYLTDSIPAGISVTALYGGDSRGGPVVGPGVMTWYLNTLDNLPPDNVAVLTYTARISLATAGERLTNTIDLLYHSLTDTIPGVRPYTQTDTAVVTTAGPSLVKTTNPITLRVGDLVTYTIGFTIPAGTVGMSGPNSYLRDTLPVGVWYITNSETLTWTPGTVAVTVTNLTSGTNITGSQVLTWTFGEPITSTLVEPTVISLSFRAVAVGLRRDTLAEVWSPYDVIYPITNTVELWQRGEFIDEDDATNAVIQPDSEH